MAAALGAGATAEDAIVSRQIALATTMGEEGSASTGD
jgi:hypothetical protein